MIFGFNTDVKNGETVYHVQSEARTNDLLLQTQVFMGGQCIGKLATSYAHNVIDPGFTDEHMHDLLKDQHRKVLDAVREGKVAEAVPPDAEVQDVDGAGLALKWSNAEYAYEESPVAMRLLVTDGGEPVAGAALTWWLGIEPGAAARGTAATDASGEAEIAIPLSEVPMREAAVLVQARLGGKSATRKFRVRKSA